MSVQTTCSELLHELICLIMSSTLTVTKSNHTLTQTKLTSAKNELASTVSEHKATVFSLAAFTPHTCPQAALTMGSQDKKLSYRRETAHQLPTWRGARPSSTLPRRSLWLHICVWSNPNPQQTYVKRTVRKVHFKLNRAFKVIQGYPYLCRQESRTVYCRNVQLMPTLFLKLTKIWQQEHSKFVDFNDPTQV